MVETEEGSNTAITTQLISIGVMERISVTSSMFTQPGRESSSEEEEESVGGGGVILLQIYSFIQSLIRMFI